jgi:hypothetical protein
VAPIWTAARVERSPETERHRENGSASGPDGDQFQEDRISDDHRATAAAGESAEGR